MGRIIFVAGVLMYMVAVIFATHYLQMGFIQIGDQTSGNAVKISSLKVVRPCFLVLINVRNPEIVQDLPCPEGNGVYTDIEYVMDSRLLYGETYNLHMVRDRIPNGAPFKQSTDTALKTIFFTPIKATFNVN
jgi:hypothetical protein